MGAGTSRSGSATRLNDAGAFVQQQEKEKAAQRSQSLQGIGRDSRSEYFDLDQFNRLNAEVDQQRSSNNAGAQKQESGSKRQNSGPALSYFDDTLNSLESMKKNYDQQRSSNNAGREYKSKANYDKTGIAFGPGRSNRGDVDLRKLLQNRMARGK